MQPVSLAEIAQKAVDRCGTKRKLAKELHKSESYVGRIVNREVKSASLEVCLLLSEFVDVSAAKVLHAANKGRMVALIEKHFGPGRERVPVQFTQDERRCLDLWEQLTEREREILEGVVGQVGRRGKKTA